MYQYAFFNTIKDDSPLAKMLNRAMQEMNTMRVAIAPQTFTTLDDKDGAGHMLKFYQFCLNEIWAHEAVNTLRGWESLLDEYFDTFSGSWKYYAISKRTDIIKEYGSDNEDDYNEDDTIRTEGLTDEELEHYTVVGDINCTTGRIITETYTEHIKFFANDVRIATQIHFMDFIQREAKERGINIPPMTLGEDGEFRPMTDTEKVFSKANREADGEEMALKIVMLDAVLKLLDQEFTNLPFNNDNTERMKDALDIIKKTLNADFEPFGDETK